MANSNERIVVLVDMDCFFCQVEVKLQPNLTGKPLAVVQYNQWQSGGIIAVNYEARDHGVSRHMRAEEAKKKCPELVLATVPGVRGKADTSRYRVAGREVVEVLRKHSNIIERASVDEAYLDITEVVNREMNSNPRTLTEMVELLPNTFVIGHSTVGNNDEAHRREAVENWITAAYGELGDYQAQRLAVAGTIVERIRADIYEKTGYRCSAGVSYNKILAKLACGLHKPNRQTILPLAGVTSLYQTLPIKKVRNLGGKFGSVVIESLGCNVMADLLSYSLRDLQTRFDDKTGLWLYNIARGTDNEPVTSRLIAKSIGSCKNFPGKQAIVKRETLEHWVEQLSLEMSERLVQDLEENNRKATLLTISYHYCKDNKTISQSRSCRLTSNKAEIIMKNFLDIIVKFASKYPIVFMGMSASKFIDIDKETTSFRNFFTANTTDTSSVNDELSASSAILTTEEKRGSPKSEKLASTIVSMKAKTHELEPKDELGISIDAKCSPSADKTDKKISSVCDMDDNNSASTSLVEPHQDIKSPMSLLRTENTKLKPDNFKKSFFMNILNANKNDEETLAVKNAEVESISDLSFAESCKDISTGISINSTIEKDGEEKEKFAKNADEKGFVVSNTNNERGLGETIRMGSPTNEKHEFDCSVNTRTEIIQAEDNTIKLQDIFPDLTNIDESIVAALPPRLQKEANLILQSQRKKVTESKVNTVKSSNHKGKEPKRSRVKASVQHRINKIDTFFNNETKSVKNSTDNKLVEKCPDCDRLIPLNEYLEHVDFHVAKNLSKEINKSVAHGAIATPEKDQTSNGKSIKRKRNKPEAREPEKRTKSIATFFS